MIRRNFPLVLLAVCLCLGMPPQSIAASVKQFTLTFNVQLKDTKPRQLIEVPGVVRVSVADALQMSDDGGQNYAAFPMKDGSAPVLEAALSLRLPVGRHELQDMKIGVPLSMLSAPTGSHAVKLIFSGARWTMLVDGKIVDNDFPLGYPEGELSAPTADAQTVSNVELSPTADIGERPERTLKATQMQYFTPEGHNAWVGDVATCYYHGRYHLFYLYDRRGHRSKFGRGGHYFEHLSTADFLTWTEHPEATPIEEQWETFGTGTPFVWHDSLFLSYGMHTSRIYPQEKTASPMQWQHIRDHGESCAVPFRSLEDLFPSGASYSTASPDGTRFTKSHVLIHPSENPTIYADEQGRLMMLANYGARGMWTSDRIEGGWHCLSEDFPPGGDCTFIFHWGNYDYIVGGFTHMWMKQATQPVEAYADMVAEGTDFYDGLSVPAFTRLPSGRVVMAGWMQLNNHWGGPLVVRELLQDADGRIGSRFMPELMPATKKAKKLAAKGTLRGQTFNLPAASGMLTFDITPTSDGRIDLTFLPAEGEENAFTWTLDLGEQRAQFSARPDERQKTLREGGRPQAAVDYAIDRLDRIQGDGKIPVRIILRSDPKFTGTVADVEIAGRRTMITYRHNLNPRRLAVGTTKANMENIKFAPFEK